jgi:hypothetical protein
MYQQNTSRYLGASVLLLALGAPGIASAQDSFIKPNPAVVKLTQAGSEAFNAQRFDDALKAFEEAVNLQPINITHLNHGRALHKVGRCKEAEEAYKKAQTVLYQVAKPSPDEINATAKRYIGDLDGSCPGELTITCEPASMSVIVDQLPPRSCDAQPLVMTLSRGTHIVRGKLGDKTAEQIIELSYRKPAAVSLKIDAPAPKDPVVVKEDPKPKDPDRLPTPENSGDGKDPMALRGDMSDDEPDNTGAWVQLGIGVGAIAAGAILDGVLYSGLDGSGGHSAGEYVLYSTPIILYVAGAIFSVSGLTSF